MYEVTVALLCLPVLVGSFWVGQVAQRFLREHHRSRESVDSIRVLMTLLVTFVALVLGLVISSAQRRVDLLGTGLRGLSVNIVELDQRLREYGPEVDPLRADLILYTRAAIADTWPEEPPPPGVYPRHLNPMVKGDVESVELDTILNRIDLAIHRLTPQDEFHRSIASTLQTRMTQLSQQRWNLIENGQPSLTGRFVAILMFWLAIIFVIAGATSPRNTVVILVTALVALSLSSSIFLALTLDRPLTGTFKIPSAPLRYALVHLTQPPLPAGAP
ncbi:MAG TPA: hypothetical protein VFE41_07150 [Acetobacteraceae bacterium]|jgi:hypothetical protein|nr:hypothetical protein [Acetobacteraceae bacterium]